MQILTRMRTLAAAGLAVALALGVTALTLGPAAAQVPDPKDQCKQGGFAGFLDPSTGRPFSNQGQCVSFVAQGGTLVAVLDLVVSESCTRPFPATVECTVSVRNAGPGTATIPAGTVLLTDTYRVSSSVILNVSANVAPGYLATPSPNCPPGAPTNTCTVTLTAVSTQTLAPNKRVSVVLTLLFSDGSATVTNTATADPGGVITELNEGNNSITVTTPP